MEGASAHSLPMSRERYSAGYAPSGGKTQKSKLFAVLLLFGAAALVIVSVRAPGYAAPLRAQAQDGLGVALEWLGTPVRGVRAFISEKGRNADRYRHDPERHAA